MADSCPMGHLPEPRGERRRMERELAATRPARGVGKGWRLNTRRNRYRVVEPPPASFERLVAESEAVAERLGCTCVREVAHA